MLSDASCGHGKEEAVRLPLRPEEDGGLFSSKQDSDLDSMIKGLNTEKGERSHHLLFAVLVGVD